MTENLIKEELSIHFVGLLLHDSGFKVIKVTPDDGVDIMVRRSTPKKINGEIIFIDEPDYMDIQVKSTTEKGITRRRTFIEYDLKASNYNKLIYRNNQKKISPMILVVFILPEEKREWIKLSQDELYLRKHAYWYVPQKKDIQSPKLKTGSVKIRIPTKNILKRSTLKKLYFKLSPQ